ncbi:hypothetical protein BGX24_007790, partial [Mortierella sp. AD032]
MIAIMLYIPIIPGTAPTCHLRSTQARLWTGAVESVGKAIRARRKLAQDQDQDQDSYLEDLHAHNHLLRASTHMGEQQARL